MKVFSLLSTAVLTTCFSVSGIGKVANPQNFEPIIAHEMGDRSYTNGMTNNQTQSNPNRVVNSVHGCVEQGFSIEGEFLWWRATLDNLEYAAKMDLISADPLQLHGKLRGPDFNFDPGVRLSAGYDFGASNWDVFVRWTYHYTDATDHTSVPIDPVTGVIINLKEYYVVARNQLETFATTASAKWTNRLNVADLEMGYDYFLSPRISLRPNFGIKAAWVDMHYDIKFGRTFIPSNVNPPGQFVDITMRNQSDYWGVGPQVGCDGNLHIGWGFSLYSRVSGALLYGAYDVRLNQFDTADTVWRIKNSSEYRERAMAQVVAGIEWAKCFSNGVLLALNIGWEGQYWWNQNEMRIFIDAQPAGDLTFKGMDVGIRVDF